MKKEILEGSVGTILSAVGTAAQVDEVLKYISLGITILGGIISMIIIPLWNWYKSAKQDGKITKEEIEEGVKIASDGVNGVKQITRKEDTKDNGEIQ